MPNSDSEIEYNGFRRVDLDKSAGHKTKLEEDGFVFCGFTHRRQVTPRHTNSDRPTPEETIYFVSSDDDERGNSAAGTSSSSITSSSTTPGVSRSDSSPRHGIMPPVKVCAATKTLQS